MRSEGQLGVYWARLRLGQRTRGFSREGRKRSGSRSWEESRKKEHPDWSADWGGGGVGGGEVEENHTGPVGSCLGPARSRGMTGSGLLFSISGCIGGNGVQGARVEVKRPVRSYSRGSK